jgi:hypothetical protein
VAVTARVPDTADHALDVTVEPPRPATFFNDAASPVIASVTLSQPGLPQAKTVTVNRLSGQVSAD